MTVDNGTGDVPGVPPSNRQDRPGDHDHDDPEAEQRDASIDDQTASAETQDKKAEKQPHWRHCFKYIRDNFPDANVWLAVFTLLLVIETFFTIRVLSTTDQAFYQTSEAEKGIRNITAFIDRPWIKIDSVIPSKLEVTKDVARIGIAFMVTNVGRSPALNVEAVPKFLPWQEDVRKLLPVQKRQCAEGTGLGQFVDEVVFPSDKSQKLLNNVSSAVALDDIRQTWRGTLGSSRSSKIEGMILDANGGINIVGCVNYTSGNGDPHQTGFILLCGQKQPNGGTPHFNLRNVGIFDASCEFMSGGGEFAN